MTEEGISETKRFEGVLLLNYKTGDMRVRKTAPKSTSPYEIPIQIDISVNMPEKQEIVAKGDFTIPKTQVKEMFLDQL